jgi:hypothetical protein
MKAWVKPIVLMAALCGLVFAQPSFHLVKAATLQEDEIIALVKLLSETKDPVILNKYLGETYHGVAIDGVVLTKETLISKRLETVSPDTRQRSYNNFSIHSYGSRLKVVTYKLTLSKEIDGRTVRDEAWSTHFYALRGDLWQLDFTQVTRIPQ